MSNLGNKKVFAKNLQHYMDKQGVDRKEVCEALSFPYSTFSEWVSGNIYPRIDRIEMLANYFGIKKSDLIEDKEEQQEEWSEKERKELEDFKNYLKSKRK